LYASAPRLEKNLNVEEYYDFEPMDYKEAYVFLLYSYKDTFTKYNINPELAITQAIQEQGFILDDEYFRIYNLTNRIDEYHPTELVIDNQTLRLRRHRIYDTLGKAIADYCKFLNKYNRYRGIFETNDIVKQIEKIGNSGYAEDKEYTTKLKVVYLTYVWQTVVKIKKSKILVTCKKEKVILKLKTVTGKKWILN